MLASLAVVAIFICRINGYCNSSNDHLDQSTHKFRSECGDHEFCLESTCVPRLCRRDEFPWGYAQDIPVPPMCPKGYFCPDEGSGCRPLLNLGEACQLSRDEQCAPPLDWLNLASPFNFNGSLCLCSSCMSANVTLGLPCIIDAIAYSGFNEHGQLYQNTVKRDNCKSPQLYCNDINTVCEYSKALGAACNSDAQCETRNCNDAGICDSLPGTALHVSFWQYTATALCIIGIMISTCIALTVVHRKERLAQHYEIRDYYQEQMNLRQSMIALHATASSPMYEKSR